MGSLATVAKIGMNDQGPPSSGGKWLWVRISAEMILVRSCTVQTFKGIIPTIGG